MFIFRQIALFLSIWWNINIVSSYILVLLLSKRVLSADKKEGVSHRCTLFLLMRTRILWEH